MLLLKICNFPCFFINLLFIYVLIKKSSFIIFHKIKDHQSQLCILIGINRPSKIANKELTPSIFKELIYMENSSISYMYMCRLNIRFIEGLFQWIQI